MLDARSCPPIYAANCAAASLFQHTAGYCGLAWAFSMLQLLLLYVLLFTGTLADGCGRGRRVFCCLPCWLVSRVSEVNQKARCHMQFLRRFWIDEREMSAKRTLIHLKTPQPLAWTTFRAPSRSRKRGKNKKETSKRILDGCRDKAARITEIPAFLRIHTYAHTHAFVWHVAATRIVYFRASLKNCNIQLVGNCFWVKSRPLNWK